MSINNKIDIKNIDYGDFTKSDFPKTKNIGSQTSINIKNTLDENFSFHKTYLNIKTNKTPEEDKDKLADILDELTNKLQDKLKKSILKRLRNIALEMGENIIKYSPGIDNSLTIDIKDDLITIKTSNLINDNIEAKEKLKNTLLELNELSDQEIKDRYKNIIQNHNFNEKGGAGLGFIEMAKLARKTNTNGIYDIKFEKPPKEKLQLPEYKNKEILNITIKIPTKKQAA